VKIGYNPLEASGEDASPERASRPEGVLSCSFAVSAAPPKCSLLSLFAQKCVFASPSFPCTYSLFQNEYWRNPQQFKCFIHSFAKHPGVTSRPSNSQPRALRSLRPHCTRTKRRNPPRIMRLRILPVHNGGGGTSRKSAHARTTVYPELRGATSIFSGVYFTVFCRPGGRGTAPPLSVASSASTARKPCAQWSRRTLPCCRDTVARSA
jgi:hypothetical protein